MGESEYVYALLADMGFFNIDAGTYPWWPAVVYEYDDPRIPLQVKAQSEAQIKKGLSVYIIQFFDKTRSWCVGPVEGHCAIED